MQHGPRSRRAVALTFHGAGPSALAEEVLRVCAQRHAAITVFAVGQWAQANPTLLRRMADAGHDIGNHTWSHQPMLRLDEATARTEVQRGAEAVSAALGSAGWLFRPSGTPSSTPVIRRAAQQAGYGRCISYDVDPRDYEDPAATTIVSRCAEQVRPGSIISLHLGHANTVAALPAVLEGLGRAGLAPVTVTDLLKGA